MSYKPYREKVGHVLNDRSALLEYVCVPMLLLKLTLAEFTI
jgi:hypothetical protein